MTFALTADCAICNATFESRTSYGLCPEHCQRDLLKEFDRLSSAMRDADRHVLPVALSLNQWLSCISSFKGMCAYCQTSLYSMIEMVDRTKGLVWSNVVPCCRACKKHKDYGWQNAVDNVYHCLAEFNDEDEEEGEICEEDEFQQVVELQA